jgi:glutathione-specific gamma-glutamylcyclotransferase
MNQTTHVMRLTPELVARVQRTTADDGPREGLAQMGDVDYAQYADELAAGFGDAPLRVFAYGSLIWNPEFEFTHQNHATLHGWHRAFCMRIERWRGTREFPGLMMALERGGCCRGLVYTLLRGDECAQLDRILRREMTNKPPTNMPRVVEVTVEAAKVKALAFTSSRTAYSYAGKQPLAAIARILARAAGHWGTGAEYLYNTVSHLEHHGIHDRNLWHLQELVAEEIERTQSERATP